MKLKSLLLAFALVLLPLLQATNAQAQAHPDKTAQIKFAVAKRLANQKVRVKIKLQDGGELKGRLDQVNDESFTVIEDKTGRKVELSYDAVAKVSGRGMSSLTKVGIVAGIAVVVVAVAVAVAFKNFDPFRGGIGNTPR